MYCPFNGDMCRNDCAFFLREGSGEESFPSREFKDFDPQRCGFNEDTHYFCDHLLLYVQSGTGTARTTSVSAAERPNKLVTQVSICVRNSSACLS
jgi:hypothetical protein